MKKNDYLVFSVTLLVVCLCSSALLALAYKTTKPIIDARLLAEEGDSLKAVLPLAEKFIRVKIKDSAEINHYEAFDNENNLIGYAFKAKGRGYSSLIQTMAGIRLSGEIINIKIMDQAETPGLGSRIIEKKRNQPQPWFQAQFSGKNFKNLSKDIHAITGATISSKAVINSVEEKAKEVLEAARNKNINLIRDEF